MMNDTQARIILTLNNVEPSNRNIYFLAQKLNKSYSALYNYLKMLETGGLVVKHKVDKRTFFVVRDNEVVEQAKNRLLVGA